MGDLRVVHEYRLAGSQDEYSQEEQEEEDPISPRQRTTGAPQAIIDSFWQSFNAKNIGKISRILPNNPYALSKSAAEPKGAVIGRPAWESYDDAKAGCIKAVEKIANECRRVNSRYRDPHFDIEWDLKTKKFDCLLGLTRDRRELCDSSEERPRAVKRVYQIFDEPKFYIDGPTTVDIRQGVAGDCWFLAALGALGNRNELELIQRVCVSRDEDVGVYGFIFHRDGEWIHVVIDDKLYLKHSDLDESRHEGREWNRVTNRVDSDEEYRKAYQAGSRALFYAQCTDQNETWLPLLEKAFAKAHGDYYSIDGGFTGEAIEDLTGGVTTELFTADILDIDKFWKDELMHVNEKFLFGCSTGRFDNWQGNSMKADRKGIEARHAYSVMAAVEMKGKRLLKIRNPWGETEWSGPWSDGSTEWTAEWMELLDHKFGNDGIFWISYDDWRRKYHFLDRTRLFGPEWHVTKQWTSLQIPWAATYVGTKFTIKLSQKGDIVVVLSQLDNRYWRDFMGQYRFSLHFRINKAGEDDYIVRSHGNYCMTRSVSAELELEAGTYDVRMKIKAVRDHNLKSIDEVIRAKIHDRQEKMVQVAMNYDLAHAKGVVKETEEEKERYALRQEKEAAELKAERRRKAIEQKRKEYDYDRKVIERKQREFERQENHLRKKKQHLQQDRFSKERARSYHQSPRRHMAQVRRQEFSPQIEGDGDVEELMESTRDYSIQDRAFAPQFDSSTFDSPVYRQNTGNHGVFPAESLPEPVPPAESILTWNPSIDSELDSSFFRIANDLPDEVVPEDTGAELYEYDPWNAVCVVGLRVFTKHGDARIEVVQPGDEVVEPVRTPGGGATFPKGGPIAPLDIDDQARTLSEDIVTPISASDKKIVQLPARPRRENSDGEKKADHQARGGIGGGRQVKRGGGGGGGRKVG